MPRVSVYKFLVAFLVLPLSPDVASTVPSRAAVFQELWETVRDQFFDPKLNGVDWQAAREQYAPKAERAQTADEFAAVVNQMLSLLRTSHTHYYTPQEPEYFQLCGIFWPVLEAKLKPFLPNGRPDYAGIGIFSVSRDGKVFVKDVFSGSPAESAGLKIGDEIVSVDGAPFQPVRCFVGKVDQPVEIGIRRTGTSKPQFLSVTPKLLDPTRMFLDAMKASVTIIRHGEVKVGYIHVWSYAGEIYQGQLEEELDSRLHDADGLVIDLRNGWGGAAPSYLRPFLVPSLTTVWMMRDGKRQVHEEAWTKPVCLLVNEGTKSGKELLAYYFKKAHRGLVVGSRTAGAVLPGQPFMLSDGSLLFLAVGDGLIDGERPEGSGIIPDVEVPFVIEYAGGKDPQKERAVETISKEVHP
jgi:carboxyl-terminal processing protease